MTPMSIAEAKTSTGKITNIECDFMEDPTYAIHIKDSTVIDDIVASEVPLDTINAKMKSGDIEVMPIKTGKKIKWFFSKIVLRIGAWLS